MYRRLSALALVLVLVASVALVAGCGGTKIPNVKDGTFVGTTPADERGSYGIATITIKGGKYTDVQYVEINGSTHTPKAAPDYTYQDGLNAIAQLPKDLVAKQDIDKVDVVAKATGTSNTFKTAVKSALANANKNAKTGMVDGTFEITTPADTHGYYKKGSITVAGGAVTAVTYNEYDANNKTKAEIGYPHQEAVDAIASLPGALMAAGGDVSKVDAVANATSTSGAFKSMMQTLEWLAAAKDGVYTTEGQPDTHGYKVVAKLVINGHKIVDASYDEINVQLNVSKTDPAAGYTHQPAIDALKTLPGAFIKAQFTGGVDSVASATSTSTSFKTTMDQLLQNAGK